MESTVRVEVMTRRARGRAAQRVVGYRGTSLSGLTCGTHRGLPSPWLTMIVSLGPSTVVKPGRPGQSAFAAYPALVGGLHTTAATISFSNEINCIAIDVDPLSSRALMGCPAAELASNVVDLEALFGHRGAVLPDQVASQQRWEDRFDALDGFLGSDPARSSLPKPQLRFAWRRLVATGGRIGIDELAGEVDWTRRHFSGQFKAEFGVTPTKARRIVRFDRSVKALEADPHCDLATVAAAAGYFDQAHMTNDWTSHAGVSPKKWLTGEFPNFQDSDSPRRALST